MNLNDMNDNNEVEITIAGETVKVQATDNIKDTLKRILQEKGINSFTILVNGEEVTSTANLPLTFESNIVEVERYVKPGIN